jgi:Flp pilus assembly protein TadG
MRNDTRRETRTQSGQSLVEFVGFVTVLLIILGGVLEIGRAYFAYVAIENGAGEGALFAAYHPTWIDDATSEGDQPEFENIVYRATHESPSGIVDWSLARVTVEQPATLAVGQPITVSVTYSHTLLTPFIDIVSDNRILPLRASATQLILILDEE